MTRIEKMDRDVAWVLAEIRRQNSTDGKLREVGYFEFEEDPEVPTLSLQSTIVVGHLQRADVLKVIKETTRQAFVKHEYGSDLMTVDDGLEIKINVAKFEELENSINQKIPALKNAKRIPITLSDKDGIYRNDGRGKQYGISKKRKALLFLIAKKNRVSLPELQKETGRSESRISSEITEINKVFRDSLVLADNIIIHNNTGGYSINNTVFEINLE